MCWIRFFFVGVVSVGILYRRIFCLSLSIVIMFIYIYVMYSFLLWITSYLCYSVYKVPKNRGVKPHIFARLSGYINKGRQMLILRCMRRILKGLFDRFFFLIQKKTPATGTYKTLYLFIRMTMSL